LLDDAGFISATANCPHDVSEGRSLRKIAKKTLGISKLSQDVVIVLNSTTN